MMIIMINLERVFDVEIQNQTYLLVCVHDLLFQHFNSKTFAKCAGNAHNKNISMARSSLQTIFYCNYRAAFCGKKCKEKVKSFANEHD